MGKMIWRTALCLAAVSVFAASGGAMAYSEEDTAEVVSFWENSSARRETEEKINAVYADITSYLTKTGSADGYDIYFKDADIEERIWSENGGKPAKKSDYTEEQEKLADTIAGLKALGDFVAVDPKKNRTVADFTESRKSGDELVYISSGGRFLLYTSSDKSRVLRVREVVSTIDNPCLFRSADRSTLELMSRDYSRVLIKYAKSKAVSPEDEGKLVYRSSDGKAFAWLSEDGGQVIGTFRECARNGKLVLLVDDRLGNIGVKNLADGYIWWSSPLGGSRDEIASPLIADELMSSTTLRYGIPAKQNNNNVLRSGTEDCEIVVSDIEGGVRVDYTFAKAGFSYPVEFTIEDDHLKASLKTAEIRETVKGNAATEITLMGAFGAAADEDGYFVVPDGCGALVRFNNERTMSANAYSRQVYGDDVTAVPTSRGAVTEQICLPVFGIVREGGAMLAVTAKGDANARLSARVSKQSNSSYNQCGFTFVLRGTDTYSLSGNSGGRQTVFESGDINSGDIEMLYFPISGDSPDYTDIAARYRQYLTDNGVTPKTDDTSPMYVDLYGGVQKKKPIFGIPLTMKQTVTDFGEAVDILGELKALGVGDIVLTYHNWTDNGIRNRVDTSAKPSNKLGGKRKFAALMDFAAENSIEVYPAYDQQNYLSGGGFSRFSGAAMRISGAFARIVSYDRAYGIPDGFRKNMSLLSPDCFAEVWSKAADSCVKSGISGISVTDGAVSLYGDYGKKRISRADSVRLTAESFEYLDDTLENGIVSDGANAYALPFVSRITDVPLTSSRFDIFDEDVPFCQIVLHGIVPYSTKAVNGAADPDDLLLMAAATGSSLSYDLLAAETSDLKDTEYDVYYYAGAESNIPRAAAEYSLLEPLLSDVSGSVITDYEVRGGVISSAFSNGTRVQVDMAAKTINFNGEVISLAGLREGDDNG